ncbi:hypothetical protein [Butyricimonas sp. Marseille-P3923]|uniref:hypothetical protein n=1 Tax=Butyricimonas sp. Marseille-P3923 TaxID=1987504 RepID=UPI0021004A4E|nr:hypothetical protein [Butyricimonas sp. Marseille-P3923]
MDKTSPILLALLANGPVRMDGVTLYRHGNGVRTCKSKRGPKKSRSEGEEQSSNQFTEVRKMWRVYRRTTGGLPVWKIWAKETHAAKSDSAFHSVNGGCIHPGEGVWAFPTFRFSMGTLEAPVITDVARDGWTVTLRWENDADRPKASASDQVYLGYFYNTQPRSPQMITCHNAHRGDGEVTMEIPAAGQPDGTPLHLYLFFGNENPDRFSPSEYAGI